MNAGAAGPLLPRAGAANFMTNFFFCPTFGLCLQVV